MQTLIQKLIIYWISYLKTTCVLEDMLVKKHVALIHTCSLILIALCVYVIFRDGLWLQSSLGCDGASAFIRASVPQSKSIAWCMKLITKVQKNFWSNCTLHLALVESTGSFVENWDDDACRKTGHTRMSCFVPRIKERLGITYPVFYVG